MKSFLKIIALLLVVPALTSAVVLSDSGSEKYDIA